MEELLQAEIKRLQSKVADLEHQLSLSVVSTGNYMQYNGEVLENVLETTDPEVVITSKEFLKRCLKWKD